MATSDDALQCVTDISDSFAQGILDSIDVMMAVLDADGSICAVNEVWSRQARMYCSPEQLKHIGIGVNYLEICRQAQAQAQGEELKQITEALRGIEFVLQRKQPLFIQEYGCSTPTRQNWYMMSVTPLLQNQGAVIAHIDITELTERKLLDEQKDVFIGIASHELRTPLTVLKGLTQLEKKKSERQHENIAVDLLNKMEVQIDCLTRFVLELLDVSKMQSGQLDYREEYVDLDALLREIVETAHQAEPGYTITIHGTSHITLIADCNKLEEIFANLLSNAIKYSPQADKVDIYVHCCHDVVQVRVRDYGIGISPEDQRKLFARFYCINHLSRQQYSPGLGLGLYIVSEILKHYGGTITIESREGQGSTFSVSLPLNAR